MGKTHNENMYTNSKFQTQLSRKLQRFRTCRKNKKCSIFHELFEYQQKMATFFPLIWSFKTHFFFLLANLQNSFEQYKVQHNRYPEMNQQQSYKILQKWK